MKGYKTVIVNAAATMLPIVDILANSGAFFGPSGATAVSLLALANIVLRWVTTTPIFKDE
jgi:hypothetical protein